MADMLRAKEAFSFDRKGVPVSVRVGELRPKGHPDVKGREDMFETVEAVAERQRTSTSYSAERATAVPGERRELTRPDKVDA